MVKKKLASSVNSSTTTRTLNKTSEVMFPDLAAKSDIECRTLLQDHILILEGLLSPAECKAFTKCIDGLPLEPTPPKKRGEAERVNHRFSVTSSDFASKLHELLLPHLPSFPYPTSTKRSSSTLETPRFPDSCNSNIRVYRYSPQQYFGPHYDDSVRDAITGAKSEWTLLIYLTGIEDGVEGGETLFYNDIRGKREVVIPPLKRGMALLHRHGQECMLHEGSPVKKGTKYVLRSDLMFMK